MERKSKPADARRKFQPKTNREILEQLHLKIKRRDLRSAVRPHLETAAAQGRAYKDVFNKMRSGERGVVFDAALTYAGVKVYGRTDEEKIKIEKKMRIDPIVKAFSSQLADTGVVDKVDAAEKIAFAKKLAEATVRKLRAKGELP
jgi:hypothetical protein